MQHPFHAGVNAFGEGYKELAIDFFYCLKSSPSCREDYIHVLNDIGLDDELFIHGHVLCRWLTFIPALDRILKNWEAINKYFLEEITKLASYTGESLQSLTEE